MPEYDPRDLAPIRPYYPEQRPGPLAYPTSPSIEAAYQERVAELLAMEQAVLARRAHLAALHGQQHQGVVVPGGYDFYQPAPSPPAVPDKAKTYALVTASTGGAVAAGGWGLAQAAPALASLATLAASTAGLATAAILAFLLLRATGGRSNRSGGTEVHVHRGAKVRVKNLHIR